MTTTSSIVDFSGTARSRPLVSPAGWVWIGVLGLLFVVFHRVALWRTVLFATGDSNWSHALVVPLIGIYYIFQKREQLDAAAPRLCWWGLPIFFTGLFGYAMGIYPIQNHMAQGYGLILALFGLVLFLLGPAVMRVLWFPVAYLVFAIKISDRIWDDVTVQLQQIAATGSVIALKFLSVPLNFDVSQTGSHIHLSYLPEPLNVEEACSGIRMLMAFVALAVAMAFLWDRSWWQRAVIVLTAAPIAVLVNIGRVTVIGLLAMVEPELAHGSAHIYIGMLMLIPAGLLFLLLGWILDKIIIHDDESPHRSASADAAGPEAAPLSPAARVDPKWAALGGGAGVGLMLLVGMAYTLLLAAGRPDLLFEGLPYPAIWALFVLSLGGLGVLVWQLLRWAGRMPTAGSRQMLAASLVAGILLTGTIGQSVVIAATRAVLIKEPVPLRHSMILFPNQLGSWEQEHDFAPLSADVIETLGTEQYVSRVYRDTTWPVNESGGEARLHVAYYTGTPDTVPHVPERCFVAGGVSGLGVEGVTLEIAGSGWEKDPEHGHWLKGTTLEPQVRVPSRAIDATRFRFGNPRNGGRVENVFYFFVANGQFLATPDHVRAHGFDIRDKYSYYCKVEVQIRGVEDPELAAERAESLLTEALPEVMAALPDWVEVTEGRWPATTAADQ